MALTPLRCMAQTMSPVEPRRAETVPVAGSSPVFRLKKRSVIQLHGSFFLLDIARAKYDVPL